MAALLLQLWKSQYQTDGLARVEELEACRTKLNARISEADETIESLTMKIANTEKVKHRLESEYDELQVEFERVRAAVIINEKRAKTFDKVSTTCYLALIHFYDKCSRSFVNGRPRCLI